MSRERIKFEGQRFERLVVDKYVGKNKYGLSKYNCSCDCGKKTEVYLCNLKSGQTKSCGCLRKEINTTHGQTNTRTYRIWTDMNKRCDNPNCKEYKNYGKRGVSVCSRWKPENNGYINFLVDIGEIPEGLTLDRIDNNKFKNGYSPENCRLATQQEQQRNKRNNIIIRHNNKEQCLQDWSKETGIPSTTIKYRLNNGWTPEESLTTPTKNSKIKQFPITNADPLWKYLNV